VRFNGDRVMRLEIAPVGKPVEIHAKNEMGDYWSKQPAQNVRVIHMGDQNPADAGKESAKKSPTLRNPGETLPADKNPDTPQMGPVEFPKGTGGSQPSTKQPTAPAPSQQQPASQPAPTQG
jgi:hypothetical protein